MSNEIFRPEGYTLLFEDHFQGTELNRDNWFERTGERLGGLNFAENVSVSDDNLHVLFSKIVENGKQIPTGGGIISNDLFGYGYYECRGKLFGGGGGLHSSFWSLGQMSQTKEMPKFGQVIELDGYEVPVYLMRSTLMYTIILASIQLLAVLSAIRPLMMSILPPVILSWAMNGCLTVSPFI